MFTLSLFRSLKNFISFFDLMSSSMNEFLIIHSTIESIFDFFR